MTLAELKAEIESGPLAAELAPLWADVFTDYPHRLGILKPDAAYQIHAILHRADISATKEDMPRADFAAAIAPLTLGVALLSDAPKREQWRDILALLPTLGDPVKITRPQLQALFDKAVADGLMTAQQRAGLANAGTKKISRVEQLGWQPFRYELVAEAKAGG